MDYVTKKELQNNYLTKDEVSSTYATKVNLVELEERLVLKIRNIANESIESVLVRLKNDMERYIGALNEDYQSRLSVVAEGVTGTWEKCERKYIELSETDTKLDTRVERIESVLVLYDTSGKVKNGKILGRKIHKHKGDGQERRLKG